MPLCACRGLLLQRKKRCFYYRIRRLCITLPWSFFPSSTARQPRGCQYRTTRQRKALGEMFPTPTFLAPPLFQLSRYRAWKVRPGGMAYTVGYGRHWRCRNSYFAQKRLQHAQPGHDASTVEAAPSRVGRDGHDQARRRNGAPRGGPHREQTRKRLKTWSKN